MADRKTVERCLAMVLEAFNIANVNAVRIILESSGIVLHQNGWVATAWCSKEILNIFGIVVRSDERKKGLAAQMVKEVIEKNKPKYVFAVTSHPAITSILDKMGPDIIEGPEFEFIVATIQRCNPCEATETKGSRAILRGIYGKNLLQKNADFQLDPRLNQGDAFLHIKRLP